MAQPIPNAPVVLFAYLNNENTASHIVEVESFRVLCISVQRLQGNTTQQGASWFGSCPGLNNDYFACAAIKNNPVR